MGSINFVLVGARNSGKTCYLSMLDSQCPGISTADDETTTYIKFQRELLDAGELPQATASTIRDLKFRYKNDKHKVDFSIDDYDGSFIESLSRRETSDDESRNILKNRIQECEGLMFFMPYEDSHDQKAIANFESEVNTIISLVEEILNNNHVELPIPVSICVTKWDKSNSYREDKEQHQAVRYIESVPAFNSVFKTLTRLFESVSVYPISSFGNTKDGVHPIKGNIVSYKIDAPIDNCLDKMFEKYDEKVLSLTNKGEPLALFKYLFKMYDDFKHHKKGEYCKTYDSLEQNVVTEIIGKIEGEKLHGLSKKQIEFYESIRQKKWLNKIDNALKRNQSNSFFRKKMAFTILSFFVVALFAGYFYDDQRQIEKSQFNYLETKFTQVNTGVVPLVEVLPQVKEFNDRWRTPLSIEPLKFLFEKDVKILVESSENAIRLEVEAIVSLATKSVDTDVDVVKRIDKLNSDLEDWIDPLLAQSVKGKLSPIKESYLFNDELRSAKINIENLTVKDYFEYKKGFSNTKIKWDESKGLLNEILLGVRTGVIGKAKAAVIDMDEYSLQKSIDDLTLLANMGDEDAITLLENEVKPAHRIAYRQLKLKKMLKSISVHKDISSLHEIVRTYWMDSFMAKDTARITDSLFLRYSEYEEIEIGSVKNLASSDEITGQKDKVRKAEAITRKVIVIGEGDNKFEFRYIRPKHIQKKLKEWNDKFQIYERALLEGIVGYISFKGDGEEDELGFRCGGLDSNDDIELVIDETNEFNADGRSSCNNNLIKWNKPKLRIKRGEHNLNAIEVDLIDNDKFNDHFFVTEENIFDYINDEKVEISVKYFTLFIEKY